MPMQPSPQSAPEPVDPPPPAVLEHWGREALAAACSATTVAALMSRPLLCVLQQTSSETLTALMLERGADCAFVVDDEDHLLGAVGFASLLRELHEREDGDEWERDEWVKAACASPEVGEAARLGGVHLVRSPRGVAGELMGTQLSALRPTNTVTDAASRLALRGSSQLPVIDGDGKLVGAVGHADLMEWLRQLTGR